MLSHDDKLKFARTCDSEELWKLVRDPIPDKDIVLNSIFNNNLNEDMAVFLARKKTSLPEVIGILATDIRFRGNYNLALAICNNSKTPLKITLSLLKFLRIFDLGDITKNQNIPISIRQKIEYSIIEKISSLPSGVKVSLAKRVSINIVIKLLEKGDKNVIVSCLESPLLTEDHLCALINKPKTKHLLIKTIAEHPKWSLRYRIKYALVRNYHTPMTYVTKFICALKTADLRELYSDTSLPSSSKPYIFSELALRDESTEIPQEEMYDLSGDEDSGFADIDMQT
jgi:hypothetical protein